LTAEGVVEYWGNEKVILRSNNKQLVINNPNNNIIMYYNLDLDNRSEEASEKKEEPINKENNSNIEDLQPYKNDPSLRFKKIAELQMMAAETQREQIRKQLTTFHSINTDNILGKYGTPSFISAKHDTTEKINDGNAANSGGMSEVPRQTIK